MMSERIYLASPHMGGSERRYVDLAFDTNWIAPLGANVTGFEQDLQRIWARAMLRHCPPVRRRCIWRCGLRACSVATGSFARA